MPITTSLDDLAVVVASQEWSPFPSADEIAFGQALAAADRAADADQRPIDDDAWDRSRLADDDLVGLLGGPAHEMDLPLLASIDPRNLSDPMSRVQYLQALDRIGGLVAAMRAEAIVAMVGAESTEQLVSDLHLEHEIAVARRTSKYGAGRAIETARALATTFPAFRDALRAGEVTETHCSILVERTSVVTDPETLARIEARVLPKAKRLTPGQFGTELAKAIAALDSDAPARVEKAKATRAVWTRQLDDGLGYLGMIHDWTTIKAIQDAVTADALAMRIARRDAAQTTTTPNSRTTADAAGASTATTSPTAGTTSGPAATESLDADPLWQDGSLGACRADAMAARILGTVAADGTLTWDRSNVEVVVNVVMDLDTLRGEAERVAELDGQPIPGATAREVAQWARAWRRFVTDPVDGHLLDYGSTTYLPAKLRDFVLARDGMCRAPGCTTKAASRLQMDHAVPFPTGSSDAGNCGALCTSCHQVKTAGLTRIIDSRADGSATWTTAWGQTIRIPPRPVLDHPAEGDARSRPTTPPGPGTSRVDARPPDIPPF